MRNRLFLIIVVISLLALVPAGLAGCSSKATPTATAMATVNNLSVADANTLIQKNANNPDFTIIDVRTQGEYQDGHIKDAINIDVNSGSFKTDVSSLDTTKTYLVYCQTGVRSANASAQMVGLGFQHVYNMTGGISDWTAAGYPTTK